MKARQLLLTALLIGASGGLIVAVAQGNGEAQRAARVALRHEGDLPSLDGAIEWLNSAPLTDSSLRGKVVLVDFWTYTCINWRRTLPYVRAWSLKYKDRGLVVIGVHTPEFEFEKQIGNVRQATREMRIGARSRTNIGRRSTSSMHKDAFDIINSEKVSTRSRSWLFKSCWRKPGPAAIWCR
jgi:thiol-disulfide isomerase/thioredoxin